MNNKTIWPRNSLLKIRKKVEESIPDAASKKICFKRDDVRAFEEKYHPHILVANRAANHFNDNVMSHFKNILQRRRKQQTLDKTFINDKRKDTQEKDLFEPNRQRIEETILELPKVFIEGDSPYPIQE